MKSSVMSTPFWVWWGDAPPRIRAWAQASVPCLLFRATFSVLFAERWFCLKRGRQPFSLRGPISAWYYFANRPSIK